MKRALALVLALAMVLTCTFAMAAEETYATTYTYTDPNGNQTTGYLGTVTALNANAAGSWDVDGNITSDDIGISCEADDVTVNVSGNVETPDNAVEVWEDAEVNIGGSIVSEATGIYIDEADATVNVAGNVVADDYAACIGWGSDATITIDGGIDSEDEGIYVYESEACVNVGGDLQSTNTAINIIESSASIEVGGSLESERSFGIYLNESTATITVDGDVTARFAGITTSGSEALVHVTGDLQASSDGVRLWNSEADITIDGNIESDSLGLAVYEESDANIEVGGDITSEANGVHVTGSEASVHVGGDVDSSFYGIYTYKADATITVDGDVNSTYGLNIESDSIITVKGNVSSEHAGIFTCGDDDSDEYGAEVTVEGNVTAGYTAIYAYEGSDVLVNGSVSSEKSDGVFAYGEDTNVFVGGDIKAYDDGVIADDGAYVTVKGVVESGYMESEDGDVDPYPVGWGLSAYNGSVIVAEGNVTGGAGAVWSDFYSNVEVNGDVTAETLGVGASGSNVLISGDVSAETCVEAYDGAYVEVNGDLEGDVGAYASDEGTYVLINGGINASETAVSAISGTVVVNEGVFGDIVLNDNGNVYVAEDAIGMVTVYAGEEGTGSLIVDGTIASGSAPTITVYGTEDEYELPEIVVYALDAEDGTLFAYYTMDGEGNEALDEEKTAELSAAVNYILRAGEVDLGVISVEGASEIEELDLQLAAKGETATVSVDTADGYYVNKLFGGDNASFSRNSDGTWSLLVVGDGGNITITAEMMHNLVYQQVTYGKAADGTDLVWKVLQVDGQMVSLVLVNGMSEVPDDFMSTAFSAEQLSHITHNGTWTALEENQLPPSLRDGLIHPCITVRLGDLLYGNN